MKDKISYKAIADQIEDPPHPGDLIRKHMKAADWDVPKTAERLGCGRSLLLYITQASASVSANMALALEELGWGTAEVWVQRQALYDLAKARRQLLPSRKQDIRREDR